MNDVFEWIKTAPKDKLQAFVDDLWEDTETTGLAGEMIEALVHDYNLYWPWLGEMERKNEN